MFKMLLLLLLLLRFYSNSICASCTLVEGGAGSVNRDVDIIIGRNNVAKNIRAQNYGFYIQGCN